jgi:hypothetical protein
MSVRVLLSIALASFVQGIATSGQAGRPTIPELVKLVAPNPVYQLMQVELLPDTLEELVAKSNIVLLGQVESSRVYMSDDQRELYTDYVVSPIGTIPTSSKTAATIPQGGVVVKRWGGQTTVDNVPVTFETTEFRFFRTGDRLLLFLRTLDEKQGKFTIVGGGVFELDEERIKPMIAHERHEAFRGLTLKEFVTEVNRANSRVFVQ